MLLSAARVLAGMRDVDGAIKFIFQPAEEGEAGGRAWPRRAFERDPDVDAIFALHAASGLGRARCSARRALCGRETGSTSTSPARAATAPCRSHRRPDPDRRADRHRRADHRQPRTPTDQPLVLSICSFRAGTKENIVPETARLEGTIRALRRGHAAETPARWAASRPASRAPGGHAEISDHHVYPPSSTTRPARPRREAGVDCSAMRRRAG